MYMLVISAGHSHSLNFSFLRLLYCVLSSASLDFEGDVLIQRFKYNREITNTAAKLQLEEKMWQMCASA